MTTTADDRLELAKALAGMLDDRAAVDTIPTVAESPAGYDESLWRELGEYGFLGLLIPEEFGGAGATLADAAVVAAELGRRVVPGPFLTSAVQATTILVDAHDAGGETGSCLAAMATGESTACVIDEHSARRDLTVTGDIGSGLSITGAVSTVVGADTAATLLVPLEVAEQTVIGRVAANAVEINAEPLADVSRRAATVAFDATRVAVDDILMAGPAARAALDRATARLSVAVAADSAAGAQAALSLATEYANSRHQFGRAIGSFQAIKHKLANMYIAADSAQAMADRAAELGDGDDLAARKAVLAAAAHCTSAYLTVAGDSIQVHGGIGFTWEHPCHRYLKRAWLNQMMLGGRRQLSATFAKSLYG